MSNFSNMQEVMDHLLKGGAITNMDDSCKDCWVSLYKGNLYYPTKEEPITDLGNPKNWRPVPVRWLTENIQQNTKKRKDD